MSRGSDHRGSDAFMTSAPVPVLHKMGTRPIVIVSAVTSFGRMRFAAASTITSVRSSRKTQMATL